MMAENGQLSVPPGFRFHPTDEELLYYYLRKKVSFEAIDLDVIREVDLNKLEPWDLEDKCRIGSGSQNEWYFFSHKDKKYPTGTRTNRATTAGFWKATGRDKAIHLTSNSKRIGMRKTLVFYTGRAPHGQKTDWIMHEYRLEDDNAEVQEDGWVVCKVFKKKNHNRPGFQADVGQEEHFSHIKSTTASSSQVQALRQNHLQALYDNYSFDGVHLPRLFSPESVVPPSFISPVPLTSLDMECSQSLLRLTSTQQQQQQQQQRQQQPSQSQPQPQPQPQLQPDRFNGDWSFLDKLLSSHPSMDHQSQISKVNQVVDLGTAAQKFPFQCLGFETDILKIFK